MIEYDILNAILKNEESLKFNSTNCLNIKDNKNKNKEAVALDKNTFSASFNPVCLITPLYVL
jgi:hypothetical protein